MFFIPRIWATRVGSSAALVLVLAAVLGITAAPASAVTPVGWQVSAGMYSEGEDLFVGAGARLGLAGITVIPNAEWVFVNSGSAYTLNLDGTLNVLPLAAASGYVGAGIGWFTVDPEFGNSHTNTAFNLIAGAGLDAIPLKPFAQLKWIVVDGDDPLVISVGARF